MAPEPDLFLTDILDDVKNKFKILLFKAAQLR